MDEVTKNAKDIYSKESAMQSSEAILTTAMHYYRKMEGKDIASKNLIAATYSLAHQVLARISDVPFHELALSVYVYCKDESCKFISKDFEACIELAGANPDGFLAKLHPFYNRLSSKLRKPGMLLAFAQFSHEFMRLRYTKVGRHINPNIILAYTDLILHTLFYLHPNKLDFTVDVVGVSINGEALTLPTKHGLFHMGQFQTIVNLIQRKNEPLKNAFQMYGMQVETSEEAEDIGRQIKIRQNVSLTMLPLINEYTFDIVPVECPPRIIPELALYKVDLDLVRLEEKLKWRRSTLPVNGVKIDFDDPSENLNYLLLKEIVMFEQVYLLYRINTRFGDFSGYYATKSGFFYSVFLDSGRSNTLSFFKSTVLFFYATAVLDEVEYQAEKYEGIANAFIFPIKAKAIFLGGKIRDTYNKHCSSNGNGSRKYDDRFDEKEILINGMIRKLPAGHKASDKAVENARRLGYQLAANETYVMPFVKRIFYLKGDASDISDSTEK